MNGLAKKGASQTETLKNAKRNGHIRVIVGYGNHIGGGDVLAFDVDGLDSRKIELIRDVLATSTGPKTKIEVGLGNGKFKSF